MSYSRWYLTDLQVHTPADTNQHYGQAGGREPNRDFAKRLIDAHRSAGVGVIAVTDHNRVDWYSVLREAGDQVGVYVFPGLEFSVNGCHLLGIWDRTDEGSRLAETFLRTLFKPNERPFLANGDPRPVTTKQVEEWAESIHKHHGLAFAPHSTAKGMGFFGPEVCRNSAELAQRNLFDGFDVNGNRTAEVLKNPRTEFGSAWPKWFISGDTRSFDSIGREAVYLKLGSEPSLEGIRQAFLMPNRIRFPARLKDTWGHVRHVEFMADPQPSWPRITKLTVAGGFHDRLEVEFGPGLSAVIGGKGTGKSAIIETLRHVLDAPTPPPELREVLKHTLRANCEATVQFVDADGQQYEAHRTGGSSAAQLKRSGHPVGVGVGRRITVNVYGQRQLQTLFERPDELRDFIANMAGPDWERSKSEEGPALEALRSSAKQIESLTHDLSAAAEIDEDLKDLRERVQRWHEGGAEQLFKSLKELADLNQSIVRIDRWPHSVHEAVTALGGTLPPPSAPSDPRAPTGLDGAILPLVEAIQKAIGAVGGSIAETKAALEPLIKAWQTTHAAERDKVDRALAAAGISRIDELKGAQKRIAEHESTLTSLEPKRADLVKLQAKRQELLERVDELRREQSRLLEDASRKLTELVSERVRVRVEPLGDRSLLVEQLSNAVAGQSARRDQLTKLAEAQPRAIAAAVREGSQALNRLGCSGATADKLAQTPIESIHRVEESPTPDLISVEINLGAGASENWSPVGQVSPGQRSMAMLALALVSGTGPLVIDQPEDDLDNRYIYQDVVRVLTRVCEHRQVIVATHNANIPVLGDAEMVIALDALADRSILLAAGGLEEPVVAEFARRILEGGDEAFQSRSRRYAAAEPV